MKLIIDPTVFLGFYAGRAVSARELELLRHRLRHLVLVIRATRSSIVFEREAWARLYADHIGVLHAACNDQEIRTGLAILRKSFDPVQRPKAPVRTWGVLSLLATAKAEAGFWSDALACTAATVRLSGEDVVIFTGLDEGRNCKTHQAGHSILVEKTRWAVYVGMVGLAGPARVSCVTCVRNTEIDWTTRFNEGLPDTAPGGGQKFQPPNKWWKKAVVATRVVSGKPAWIDEAGNGWVAPNTPGVAYHWDVHFQNVSASPNGLNPCNIVKWGGPAAQGAPGAIHHVPTGKAARVK